MIGEMPRRTSKKRENIVFQEENNVIDDLDDSIIDKSIQITQNVRRTKSYPEELLRNSMKTGVCIPDIVTNTSAMCDEHDDSDIFTNDGINRLDAHERSKNYKRLKSCGQLQSALVTMAIRDCEVIQLWRLLSRKDVDINETDGAGMKPIHYACLFGHFEILKILLQHDVDVNSLTKEGLSPLDIAVREGNFEIAQYLVKTGAQVKSIVNGIVEKDNRRRTYGGRERKRSSLYSFSNEI